MSSLPLGVAQPLPREKVEHFEREAAALVRRYPPERRAAALLPLLRAAQELFGYLSPEVQGLVAELLGVSPARVDEVATFYLMFHTRPLGRHLVEMCTNVSCCLTGAERIWAHLKKKLGVKPGETTADGRITLREVECLGSCGTAPAMLVDEEMHERVTLDQVDGIVGGLK